MLSLCPSVFLFWISLFVPATYMLMTCLTAIVDLYLHVFHSSKVWIIANLMYVVAMLHLHVRLFDYL